jgi:hypothetical protein
MLSSMWLCAPGHAYLETASSELSTFDSFKVGLNQATRGLYVSPLSVHLCRLKCKYVMCVCRLVHIFLDCEGGNSSGISRQPGEQRAREAAKRCGGAEVRINLNCVCVHNPICWSFLQRCERFGHRFWIR